MFVKAIFRLAVFLAVCVVSLEGKTEYGDVVLNNFSDEVGIRPVVFPHWFHRIRYTCKVCHDDLEFKFKAGGNKMKMSDIINGRYCGACHNGKIAWDIENCDLCHSAELGSKTKVHNSTQQRIQDVRGDGPKKKKTKKAPAPVPKQEATKK